MKKDLLYLGRQSVLLGLLFMCTSGWLAAEPVKDAHTEVELVAAVTAIQPGQPFFVALRMKMDEHWHSYWVNPGDSGLATNLSWELPEGFEASEIQWPTPQRFEVAGLVSYAYEGEIFLPVEITPPAALPDGEITLKAKADWLACEEACIPGKAELSVTLPSGPETGPSEWADALAAVSLPVERGKMTAGWDGDKALLHFEGDWGEVKSAYFFPREGMIWSAAAAQPLKEAGRGHLLQLEPDPGVESKPTRLHGVLAIDTADGQRLGVLVDTNIQDSLNLVGGGQAAPKADTTGLLGVLLLAFVGGLILNLMPCVFPVLSLKVLGFVEQANEGENSPLAHGLVFVAGVLVSFWVLAGTLLLLRTGGQKIGWGFQLQSPAFASAMALLFLLIALNLFGIFEIGESLTTLGDVAESKSGMAGSFWSGVLTTVTATPCTAPFMGSAIGYTLHQPAIISLAVFSAVGLGTAAPYFILTNIPALLKYVPRPGAWMDTLKQVLAFPLLLTWAWLVWVVARLEGTDALGHLLVASVAVGAAAWAYGRYGMDYEAPKARKGQVGAVALLLVAGWLVARGLNPVEGIAWQPYSDQFVAAKVEAGEAVFIDFTADWCQSCKVNETVALSSSKVKQKFEELGVVPVKADWTKRDSEITDALARFGRNGVPLYVLYPGKGAEPVVLPNLLAPGTVMEYLERVET